MARKSPQRAPVPPDGPQFVPCEQGDDDWRMARLGILTASEFGAVMAQSDERVARTRVLHRLAGERLSGEPSEEWSNRHMERGRRMEPIARARYEKVKGVEVARVGFIKNFSGLRHCGCSPDGLVDFHKGIEIKSELPELLIPRLLRGASVPGEHIAQVQGNMWISDREAWDLMIFWPGLPDFIVEVPRNDRYIAELDRQVQIFNFDLQTLIERLRKMGVA